MKQFTASLCLAAVGLIALPAEAQVQRMRANIRGGSEGKCTFEVVVDGVAEVEIHGEMGVLRTLQGATATWRRLECTQALPSNPGNFRFKGVDGRGRQTLIRDPRSTGGIAVVRLEDPSGGSEGYTGDILWEGGDYHWGGGGNWSSGGSGWNDSWSNNNRGISYRDAVNICKNQVSRVRGIPAGDVRVTSNGAGYGGANAGGYELRFDTNNYRGNITGQCSVSSYGRLVNFNINGGGWNDRISHHQAMTICEQEVMRRLQVGESNVRMQNTIDSGSGNFLFNWQGRRNNGSIATGNCSVTPDGRIARFDKW
jgi:hypothetical protein